MSSTAFRTFKPCVLTSTARIRPIHTTPSRSALYSKPDSETFKKVIGAKGRVVLVDFYADWCGPCHQLSPVIECLTQEPNKSGSGLPLDLVKIDTDSNDGMELGQTFKVSALPTVIAFRDGTPVTKFVGAINEHGVKDFLQKL